MCVCVHVCVIYSAVIYNCSVFADLLQILHVPLRLSEDSGKGLHYCAGFSQHSCAFAGDAV